MPTPVTWTHSKENNATTVVIRPKSGESQHFLLTSDRHHDHAKCDRSLEKRHLQEAIARDAYILDFGDLFDAMQGPGDKRASKAALRSEHSGDDYVNRLVKDAASFYQPYANRWILMARGNHETGFTKHNGVDLTQLLTQTVNDRNSASIIDGGYSGWVRFRVFYGPTQSRAIDLWYTHGYGGGGPVTQDTIQAQRQMAYVNSDITVSGHTHDQWLMRKKRLHLNKQGVVEMKDLYQIKCPTYKDAYGNGAGGFEIEKGHQPKPLGCVWMKITPRDNVNPSISFEMGV